MSGIAEIPQGIAPGPERAGTGRAPSVPQAQWARNDPSKTQTDTSSGDPRRAVHALLFLVEFSRSTNPQWRANRRRLELFFTRHGGLHLLLMLLNAYYNKPRAGRRPGWTFSSLRHRLQISERGLRMLINDAIADGLIEQLPVSEHIDRRCRSYCLTPGVVEAWEALMACRDHAVEDVLEHFDAGALANADYRAWEPDRPAIEQMEDMPPSGFRHRP